MFFINYSICPTDFLWVILSLKGLNHMVKKLHHHKPKSTLQEIMKTLTIHNTMKRDYIPQSFIHALRTNKQIAFIQLFP